MKLRNAGRWLASLLCTGLLCQVLAAPAFAAGDVEKALTTGTTRAGEALEAENTWSLSDLRQQFPEGRYWNHADNPGSGNNDVMHTSGVPCPWHDSEKGFNRNTCNHYKSGYYCCWGYADQIGSLYSGSDPETWEMIDGSRAVRYVDSLQVGDIVRFQFNSGAEHSMFVTRVTSNRVYYTDCNVDGKCGISWSNSQTKDYFRSHILWVRLLPGHTAPPDPGPWEEPDALGCTTAYAGWYQETGKGGANVNSGHNKKWNSWTGDVIGYGQYVYVSKATGNGSGNLGHILYNGAERYIAMGLFRRMSGSPVGVVDTFAGSVGGVSLTGWAFDWDNCEAQLQINVYLDNELVFQGKADAQRADVNQSYSNVVGDYHGFSLWVPTGRSGSHSYSVYAINVGAGDNSCIGSGTVDIPADRESPSLSDWKIYNVTSEGFDVSCVSTDNVGVDRVNVQVWQEENSRQMLLADRNGDLYTCHVGIDRFGNLRGKYYVQVYSYDAAGNGRYNTYPMEVVVPEPKTVVTFDPCGGTAEFASKELEPRAEGSLYGALPDAWMDGYVFEGWYTAAAGGTRVSRNTVCPGDMTLYAHWTAVASDAAQGWSLQDGTLVIFAQGAMQDYASAAQTPWFGQRAEIRRIVVQNGVTTIGNYAFYGCENAVSISLPGTLRQIGRLAFYGCGSLETITVPASVEQIGDYAFAKDTALQTLVFRGSAPVLGAGIFADVDAEVRYPAGDESWTADVMQSYTGSVRWAGAEAQALSVQDSGLQLDDSVLEALLTDSCV